MPSPAGHFLAGLTAHILTAPREDIAWPTRAGVTVAAALVPDLDLFLRLVDGRNHHQAESHSLGCAAAAAALTALVAWATRMKRPGALATGVFWGWTSHVFLDYFGRDTHPPIGLMALWPLSESFFKSPWPFFLDIGRTLEWETLQNNAVAVAWELLILCPVLTAAWRWRSRRGAI